MDANKSTKTSGIAWRMLGVAILLAVVGLTTCRTMVGSMAPPAVTDQSDDG